jgi:hypothetical protein
MTETGNLIFWHERAAIERLRNFIVANKHFPLRYQPGYRIV